MLSKNSKKMQRLRKTLKLFPKNTRGFWNLRTGIRIWKKSENSLLNSWSLPTMRNMFRCWSHQICLDFTYLRKRLIFMIILSRFSLQTSQDQIRPQLTPVTMRHLSLLILKDTRAQISRNFSWEQRREWIQMISKRKHICLITWEKFIQRKDYIKSHWSFSGDS